MKFFRFIKAKYKQWLLRGRTSSAIVDITTPIPTSLILDMLDSMYREGLYEYRIKDGFNIWIDSGYSNIDTLLKDLEAVCKAISAGDLVPINSRLIRRETGEKLLVDFLVDTDDHIYSIVKAEETLRNRVSIIHAIVIAADSDVKKYYLRKLTNILRETFVVTEALLKAAESTCQNPIKRLIKS